MNRGAASAGERGLTGSVVLPVDGAGSLGQEEPAGSVLPVDGAGSPRVGDVAPDFTAPNVHGAPVSLPGLRGRAVLVVFVPFAFTPVCTDEAAALQQAWPAWQDRGVELLMISCDAVPTLRRWAEVHQVTFEVLSDFWPHGRVARAYGAFSTVDGAADRVSVLIDAGGVVRWQTRSPRGTARSIADYDAAFDAVLESGDEESRTCLRTEGQR